MTDSFRAVVQFLAAILSLSLAALAQEPFRILTTRAFDTAIQTPGEGVTGDVDGDGDLDVFVPTSSFSDRLYLNDGDGVFRDVSAVALPTTVDWTHHAAFVDVDGDGDQDLVTAGNSGLQTIGSQNRLLLNDGTGVFTDVTTARFPVDQDKTRIVLAFDVDADGDADVLALNSISGFSGTAVNRLYLNDGTGRFTDVTATQLPSDPGNAVSGAVGDLDGDGDLDFAVAHLFIDRPIRIYLNDGSGRFSVQPSGGLPVLRRNAYRLHLVDIESDGDLDVVAILDQALSVLVNDGTARFTDQTAQRVPPGYVYPYQAGDFDLDGDVDFTVATSGGGAQLLANDGTGVFGFAAAITATGDTAADVDGDGDLDLVLTRSGDVHLNDGTGRFQDRLLAERRAPDFQGRPGRGAVADVDGDGDLDVWLSSSLADADQLLLNDGRGSFTASPSLPRNGERSSVVVCGDVDGDGDQDALLGNTSSLLPTRLLLGDGMGGFTEVTASRMPPRSGQTTDLELVDVDGDGDLDLVEVNYHDSSGLLLNDGAGTFTAAPRGNFPTDADRSRCAVAFDVDGDGDRDLLFGNYSQPARLYLNDGIGRFTDVSMSRLPAVSFLCYDVVAIDVEGDGDSDAVFVDFGGDPHLFLNDGAGRFTEATQGNLPTTLSGELAHAIDWDGDGDVDLVAGDRNGLSVLDNDGQGRFTELQVFGTWAFPVGAADLDQDDDPDVMLVAENGRIDVATGLRRQLHFGRLVRVGRDTLVDVHAVGRTPGSDLAIPVLAAGPARLVVPGLGVVGVAPRSWVVGPAITLLRGADVGSWVLRVPTSPSLLGTTVYAQALVAEGSSLALTNTQRVEIVH